MGVPIVPCVLGFVLGPMLELMLRRSLAISQGDPSVFLTRPISVVLLLLAVAVLTGPWLLRRARRTSASAQADG